ncbi:unnamed protein product [Sphenostylis stenocarpa]|uniref:Histidine-containing phosphotransfer protein n=1 Tax=Sphenostylis stenocarpa TaxID=92480 RepID=A0AA86TNX5_9FABA|nr:unnamed protein product [Sphenostylis stenocarpa]
MDKTKLRQQAMFIRRSLFDEGFLDEQFIQLEELQDDVNPNFVEEIVTLFYSDSIRLISNIERGLMRNPPNFTKLDDYMHQFKGSCSSIGAKKVTTECSRFSEYCAAENSEGIPFQMLQDFPTDLSRVYDFEEEARDLLSGKGSVFLTTANGEGNHKSESYFSSLGGANCRLRRERVQGSRDALCGG